MDSKKLQAKMLDAYPAKVMKNRKKTYPCKRVRSGTRNSCEYADSSRHHYQQRLLLCGM